MGWASPTRGPTSLESSGPWAPYTYTALTHSNNNKIRLGNLIACNHVAL
jgi:hypothetical protein